MKAKKKRGVEAPPKVAAFIDRVVSTPFSDIKATLANFIWDFEKGDFYQWVDLFNHFDSFFEQHIESRNDLLLFGPFLQAEAPFPKQDIMQILRVTRIILENCANKHLYSSVEHISVLLASTDVEVVIAALEVLAAFVKKPFLTRSGRWHGEPGTNAKLFSLSQGWGGKEEGLGLLACASGSGLDLDAQRLGSTLHFEFYASGSPAGEGSSSGLKVIHIPDVHMLPEKDLELLERIVQQYAVPLNLRFSLLTRLRFACAFTSLENRRQYIRVRLLAFTVLLQSNPDHEDLTAFFVNEPEFVNELVMLLRAEEVVPEEIRSLAILALTAQSQDRPRQSNVLNVIGAGGHRGILPSLMQKAICSLTTGVQGSCSVSFVEALLGLVAALVNTSSGCASLREAGLIPTLLPLLKDSNPQHSHLLSSAVHILETFMDFSNSAAALFRDLGGLDDTIERLKLEVAKAENCITGKVEMKEPLASVAGLSHTDELGSDQRPMAEDGDKGKMPMQEDDAGQDAAIGSLSAPADTIPYSQRLLLKALLRAIALANYAPGSTARLHGVEESSLPGCLCVIFRHAKVFGGGVFSLAASVMSGLIHHDPTCYPTLDAAGLPKAFLDSIANGVLPSSEAICVIPNALIALCLNNAGLQAVKDRNALSCFVTIFTSKQYQKALSGETPTALGAGLDELMRHVPSLRAAGITMSIDILKTIASIGGGHPNADRSQNVAEILASAGVAKDGAGSDVPVPMDTDGEDKADVGEIAPQVDVGKAESADQPPSSSVAVADVAGVDVETFLPECIGNTVRFLESMLSNSENSRLFIEQKGLEALLMLYTLPKLPLSFGGSSTAQGMSITFRAFSPQHSNHLNREVSVALREWVKVSTTLVLKILVGNKLSEIPEEPKSTLIRCLAAAESFLGLTAVLVRSSASMMTELAGAGAELFANICKIYLEVLWQLAVLEDSKMESKAEGEAAGTAESRDREDVADITQLMRFMDGWGPGGASGVHVGGEYLPFPLPDAGITHQVRQGARAGGVLHRVPRPHPPHAPAGGEGVVNLTHVGGRQSARVPRQFEVAQADLDGPSSSEPAQTEAVKGKPTNVVYQEVMLRLVAAVRMLFVALAKVMVVPSRRRDDVANLTLPAKKIAGSVASVFLKALAFEGKLLGNLPGSSSESERPLAIKCWFMGKVVGDLGAVLLDNQRRTCNTALLNHFYAFGTMKELLTSFEATSQLLWTLPPQSTPGTPMETEMGKGVEEKVIEKREIGRPWLNDTLRSYSRLLEQVVHAPMLLAPTLNGQLLVQPVVGAIVSVPSTPEAFVRQLQSEVLEVVLPIWRHPRFPECNPAFIASITATINNIYTGVGDGRAAVRSTSVRPPEGPPVRPPPPPPDEALISMIVEMGFPRHRAEEALRRVGSNSVEMAMEWLFSHPAEEATGEDDELARALALSMTNVDTAPKEQTFETQKEEKSSDEGDEKKGPPVEEMLETAVHLLEHSEAVAFPLTDLLLTIIGRNKGEDRPRVLKFLAEQLRQNILGDPKSKSYTGVVSTVAHILALVCAEDVSAREMVAKSGLAKFALDFLSTFAEKHECFVEPGTPVEGQAPKWVTALLLVLDYLLQYKPVSSSSAEDAQAPSSSQGEGMQQDTAPVGHPSGHRDNATSGITARPNSTPFAAVAMAGSSQPEVISSEGAFSLDDGDAEHARHTEAGKLERNEKDWLSDILCKFTGYLSDEEQIRALRLCVDFIKLQLPSTAMQAVLQLCARLTKRHSLALEFFERGGLPALLCLPKDCLFSTFDTVAASIIRHLLEDSQTLQAAMESEIKHTLSYMQGRQGNRTVSVGPFLTAMAPLITRQPVIFMRAAGAVCQVETVNGRTSVVLAKDKEKEKEKDREKEKDKEKDKDKEKVKERDGKVPAQSSSPIPMTVDNGPAAPGFEGNLKGHELILASKSGRLKRVPSTFAQVIDQLLEVILHYPAPGQEVDEGQEGGVATAMEVDEEASKDSSIVPRHDTKKGKSPERTGKDEESSQTKTQSSAALTRLTFVMRLMTEILLMYSSSSAVVLRRDTESSQASRTPVSDGGGHGGLLHHVFHRLLPYAVERGAERPRIQEDRPLERLGDRAAYFLMALCVRSGEGRRRVVAEMAKALKELSSVLPKDSAVGSSPHLQAPNRKVRAFVDLANSLLSHPPAPNGTPTPGVSSDMAQTMIEAGMVQALTQTLQSIDLDHPDAPKLVSAVLKALEALTRVTPTGEQGVVGIHGSGHRRVSGQAERATGAGQRSTEGMEVRREPTAGVNHSGSGHPDEHMRDSNAEEAGDGRIRDARERHATEDDDRHERDSMEHDQRVEEEEEEARLDHRVRLAVEEANIYPDSAAELEMVLQFNPIERAEEEDEGQHDDDEEDMEGDDGDEEGDDLAEDDDDDEELDEDGEDDQEGDEGGQASPPDSEGEDHEDDEHGLGEDYDEEQEAEDDEEDEDDWEDQRMIEVRWRDGLTGMDRVQLLAGGADIGGMLDFPGGLMQRGPSGDPVYMNIDEVFSTFRRAAGAERRRGTFRGFSQPLRQTQGGGFSHPLLTRPPVGAGDGADAVAVMAPVANPGILGRLDPDEFPGRDMAQLMFYDHPLLAEQMADGLLNQRTFGGGPSQLLDFAEDPMYMMWRTGRMDGRLSNWTDDGLPQSGAYASAIAQAIENDFLATIRAIGPTSQGGQPATGNQPVDPPASAGTETRAVQENVAAVSSEMVGGVSSQAEGGVNNVSEGHPSVAGTMGSEEPAVGAVRGIGEEVAGATTGEDPRNSTERGQFGMNAIEGVEGSRQAPDSDVLMQENRTERTELAGRDAEGTSQDSGGSGATVGESLRSLEVEVGSVDGHDENERLTTERIPPPGDTAMRGSGEGNRQVVEGRDRDEEMQGVPSGGIGAGPGEDRGVGLSAGARMAENTSRVLGTSGLPASVPVGGAAPVSEREEHDIIAPDRREAGEVRPQTGTDIDPTFLEALPEDLRAEVLASQQAQVTRATNTQATAPEDMGELDPEFLAALPPDIQAEVLAQQRAQRALAAHTTAEGQPVDMDSASIIATFPAELREEVLLTSSEAVLAALPPALLAEAQLLRERAMNQYQARGLYAGQRLGGHHRRAHVGGGAGGGSAQAVAGATDPRAASARPRGYSPYQLGSGTGGTGTGTASGAGKGKETEGKPLVDANALKALLRLLRLAQPLGKGLLQRLLLNLCSHSMTRASLLQLLLDMLRPEAEGVPVGPTAADGAPPQRLYGCQFNVVYARAQSSDGVPPLVSRRVLEILTYLARHHNQVAHQLLLLERPESTIVAQQGLLSPKAKEKGKSKVVEGSFPSEKSGEKIKEVPLVLLLKLLNQPLYYRSSAHLEQVMGLLEVVTRSAGVEAAESRNRMRAAAAARAAEVASAAAAAAANAAAAARAAMPSVVSTTTTTSLTTTLPHQTPQETAQPMQEGNTQDAEVAVGISPTPTTPVPVVGSVTDSVTEARSSRLDGDEAMGAADPSSEVIFVARNREDGAAGAEIAEAQIGTEAVTPTERTPAAQASQYLATGAEPESAPVPIALTVLSELPKSELRTLCQLLAREGLSDTAYARVSTVLKLLADSVPPHRQLFIEELADAARQLSGRAIAELQVLGENDALVNTGSMAGAATLRVLQTLSALLSMNGSSKEKAGETAGQEKEEGLSIALELNTALEPLWQGLSACATKFEARLGNSSTFSGATAAQTAAGGAATGAATPLPPGIQKLLPFVEGFFVLCERMRASQGEVEVAEEGGRMAAVRSASVNGTGPSSSSAVQTSDLTSTGLFKGPGSGLRGSTSITEGGGMTLAKFAEKHRRLLNAFIRQNHGLLESSFSLQLRTPWLLDFDNKRTYFRSRIRQQHEQPHYGNLRISVRRAYVLEDSYNQLRMRTPEELKGRLTVQFQAEEGIDAGGLTREWYLLLSRVIFDKGALLFTTVGNDATFQPNPNSVLQPEHLSYFKFVGRVVAKALYDGQLLDVYFTRSFYKHILGTKVTYHDIEAIDPGYYKNLKWMLENDISDILDLTFSMDADEEKHILYEKGEVTDYELIPGGRNVRVTEENKEEYVNRVAEYRLTVAIRPQINAFLEGFTELIPRDLISIFNDKELELLISGLPEIDIENLRANTEYTGFTVASPVIQWFWEVVKTFSKEDCARLLQFITGTSKVPLEGFKALQGISGPQKFQIHKAYGAPERLPSAHTCFNQLDLPEYPSKEQLQDRLLLAIHEGNEGFGFG